MESHYKTFEGVKKILENDIRLKPRKESDCLKSKAKVKNENADDNSNQEEHQSEQQNSPKQSLLDEHQVNVVSSSSLYDDHPDLNTEFKEEEKNEVVKLKNEQEETSLDENNEPVDNLGASDKSKGNNEVVEKMEEGGSERDENEDSRESKDSGSEENNDIEDEMLASSIKKEISKEVEICLLKHRSWFIKSELAFISKDTLESDEDEIDYEDAKLYFKERNEDSSAITDNLLKRKLPKSDDLQIEDFGSGDNYKVVSKQRRISNKSTELESAAAELEPIIRTAIRSKWDSDYEESPDRGQYAEISENKENLEKLATNEEEDNSSVWKNKSVDDENVCYDSIDEENFSPRMKSRRMEDINSVDNDFETDHVKDNIDEIPMDIDKDDNDESDPKLNENDEAHPVNIREDSKPFRSDMGEKLASEYEEFLKMVSFEPVQDDNSRTNADSNASRSNDKKIDEFERSKRSASPWEDESDDDVDRRDEKQESSRKDKKMKSDDDEDSAGRQDDDDYDNDNNDNEDRHDENDNEDDYKYDKNKKLSKTFIEDEVNLDGKSSKKKLKKKPSLSSKGKKKKVISSKAKKKSKAKKRTKSGNKRKRGLSTSSSSSSSSSSSEESDSSASSSSSSSSSSSTDSSSSDSDSSDSSSDSSSSSSSDSSSNSSGASSSDNKKAKKKRDRKKKNLKDKKKKDKKRKTRSAKHGSSDDENSSKKKSKNKKEKLKRKDKRKKELKNLNKDKSSKKKSKLENKENVSINDKENFLRDLKETIDEDRSDKEKKRSKHKTKRDTIDKSTTGLNIDPSELDLTIGKSEDKLEKDKSSHKKNKKKKSKKHDDSNESGDEFAKHLKKLESAGHKLFKKDKRDVLQDLIKEKQKLLSQKDKTKSKNIVEDSDEEKSKSSNENRKEDVTDVFSSKEKLMNKEIGDLLKLKTKRSRSSSDFDINNSCDSNTKQNVSSELKNEDNWESFNENTNNSNISNERSSGNFEKSSSKSKRNYDKIVSTCTTQQTFNPSSNNSNMNDDLFDFAFKRSDKLRKKDRNKRDSSIDCNKLVDEHNENSSNSEIKNKSSRTKDSDDQSSLSKVFLDKISDSDSNNEVLGKKVFLDVSKGKNKNNTIDFLLKNSTSPKVPDKTDSKFSGSLKSDVTSPCTKISNDDDFEPSENLFDCDVDNFVLEKDAGGKSDKGDEIKGNDNTDINKEETCDSIWHFKTISKEKSEINKSSNIVDLFDLKIDSDTITKENHGNENETSFERYSPSNEMDVCNESQSPPSSIKFNNDTSNSGQNMGGNLDTSSMLDIPLPPVSVSNSKPSSSLPIPVPPPPVQSSSSASATIPLINDSKSNISSFKNVLNISLSNLIPTVEPRTLTKTCNANTPSTEIEKTNEDINKPTINTKLKFEKPLIKLKTSVFDMFEDDVSDSKKVTKHSFSDDDDDIAGQNVIKEPVKDATDNTVNNSESSLNDNDDQAVVNKKRSRWGIGPNLNDACSNDASSEKNVTANNQDDSKVDSIDNPIIETLPNVDIFEEDKSVTDNITADVSNEINPDNVELNENYNSTINADISENNENESIGVNKEEQYVQSNEEEKRTDENMKDKFDDDRCFRNKSRSRSRSRSKSRDSRRKRRDHSEDYHGSKSSHRSRDSRDHRKSSSRRSGRDRSRSRDRDRDRNRDRDRYRSSRSDRRHHHRSERRRSRDRYRRDHSPNDDYNKKRNDAGRSDTKRSDEIKDSMNYSSYNNKDGEENVLFDENIVIKQEKEDDYEREIPQNLNSSVVNEPMKSEMTFSENVSDKNTHQYNIQLTNEFTSPSVKPAQHYEKDDNKNLKKSSPPSPLGFKRSLADSTSDNDVVKPKKLSKFSTNELSPKRISLDERLERELGMKNDTPPPPPPPLPVQSQHSGKTLKNVMTRKNFSYMPHTQSPLSASSVVASVTDFLLNASSNPPNPAAAINWDNPEAFIGPISAVAALQSIPPPVPPQATHTAPQVLQVGNMLQVIPTEPMPIIEPITVPPHQSQQINSVQQNSPPAASVQSSAAVASPLKLGAMSVVASTTPTMAALFNKDKHPLALPMPPAMSEAEKAEQRKLEKERRRQEKELRRQAKLKAKTKKMIRKALLFKEGMTTNTDFDNEEMKLIEEAMDKNISADEDNTSGILGAVNDGDIENISDEQPEQVCIATVFKPLPPPPDKGILISPGFREKPLSGEKTQPKVVSFADGVKPGEGTSPSAGEDHPLSPPPATKLPKEKRFTKKKKKKKKVKVRIIRVGEGEDDDGDEDEDEDASPPPPPPGSPPPMYQYPPSYVYSANTNVASSQPSQAYSVLQAAAAVAGMDSVPTVPIAAGQLYTGASPAVSYQTQPNSIQFAAPPPPPPPPVSSGSKRK